MRNPLVLRPSVLTLPAVLFVAACGASSAAPTTPATPTAASTDGAGTGALGPAGSAGSKRADRMTSPAWAPCHGGYKVASADLGAEVGKMAKGCAGITKMHLVSDTFKGTQAASNPPQSFRFKAQAKHCYRAYGAAASSITDLDLLIKDSEGAVAGEDSTDDPTPVVLEDGAVCFKTDDDATVVVSVGAGQGDYALQVWSD